MHRFLSILFLVLLTASCGGGSSEDPSGLGVCNPPSAAVGTQVTCTVDDTSLDADCTVFFGGTPVEAVLNEEEGTITFTIPPGAPGTRDITFQCGSGDPKIIASDFAVSAPPPPAPAACEDNSDCSGGLICQGGSCVTPSAPASGCVADTDCLSGMTCQGGSCVEVITPPGPECSADISCSGGRVCQDGVCVDPPPPPDGDGDGVADATDACPGTTAGTAVGTDGCPTPLNASITVTKYFEDRIGLVKIHWDVQGGEALDKLYIYSNGFYRTPGDAALSGDDGCKTVDDPVYTNRTSGKRRLLVRSNSNDGEDYNDGASELVNLSPMLDGAQRCKDDGSNCLNFEGVGTVPTCRIDLKDASGNLKRSGTIYTRVLVKDAVFKLRARTRTGEAQFLESTEVDVSGIDITDFSFDNLVNEAKVRVSFVAENAIKKMADLRDCQTMVNSYDDKQMGKITFEAKCPMTNLTPRNGLFGFTAYGIGHFSVQLFMTTVGDPQVTIVDAGEHHCDDEDGNPVNFADCKGTLNIEARVKRTFSLQQVLPVVSDGLKLSGQTTHGIPSIKLYANNGDNRTENIAEKNEEARFTFTDVPRNHAKYKWHGRVTVGGMDYDSGWLNKPYDATFEAELLPWPSDSWDLDQPHVGCSFSYDDDDAWIFEGDSGCMETYYDVEVTRVHPVALWNGKHLKEVRSSCGGTISIDTPQPLRNDYGLQQGKWARTFDGNDFSCRLTGVGYDGTEITIELEDEVESDDPVTLACVARACQDE